VRVSGIPILPKCRDCGGPSPRVVTRRRVGGSIDAGPEQHEWLCAACEYLRQHPNAAPDVPLPRERRPLPLQSGKLW
jgi:hypothetical protein